MSTPRTKLLSAAIRFYASAQRQLSDAMANLLVRDELEIQGRILGVFIARLWQELRYDVWRPMQAVDSLLNILDSLDEEQQHQVEEAVHESRQKIRTRVDMLNVELLNSDELEEYRAASENLRHAMERFHKAEQHLSALETSLRQS